MTDTPAPELPFALPLRQGDPKTAHRADADLHMVDADDNWIGEAATPAIAAALVSAANRAGEGVQRTDVDDPTREQLAEHLHYLCGDWDEDWRGGDWLQLADAVLKIIRTRDAALLERLCQMVQEIGGLSTGHADTMEDLMREVLWQVKELNGAKIESRQLREMLHRNEGKLTELRALLEETKDACLHWSPELFERMCTALGKTVKKGDVSDIPDSELVERAVRNARHGREEGHVLWSYVTDAFGLGSTYAAQLCRRFGLDPEHRTALSTEGGRE